MFLPLVLAGLLLGQAATPAQSAVAEGALIESAKAGDLARVRELLSKGASVNTSDRRGLTPLMWASAGGSVEIVRHLLENGAAVDRRANDGTTALMLAAANGFVDVARALLVRGTNVAAVRAGVTARQLAQERGHPEMVALIEPARALSFAPVD